jgi:hypothetical protein
MTVVRKSLDSISGGLLPIRPSTGQRLDMTNATVNNGLLVDRRTNHVVPHFNETIDKRLKCGFGQEMKAIALVHHGKFSAEPTEQTLFHSLWNNLQLNQNAFHDFAVNVGQSILSPLVSICQPRVVDAA